MMNPFGPGADLLGRLREIADVLVPMRSALESAVGPEEARAVMARGLAAWRRRLWDETATRVVGEPRDRWEKVTADALESAGDVMEVADLAEEPGGIRFAVTRCRIAEFFRSIGEAELGYELACAQDLAQVEALGGGQVTLAREGTLMTGAPRCDFSYCFGAGPSGT